MCTVRMCIQTLHIYLVTVLTLSNGRGEVPGGSLPVRAVRSAASSRSATEQVNTPGSMGRAATWSTSGLADVSDADGLSPAWTNVQHLMNDSDYTLSPEIMQYLEDRACLFSQRRFNRSEVYCNATYDGVSCWPTTVAGEVVHVRCPRYFGGVEILDPTKNASRMCYKNGTWNSWSNYSLCKYVEEAEDTLYSYRVQEIISDIGSAISLVALVVALVIFLRFRSLRCSRNVIHCHLISSFIAKYFLHFITTKTMKMNMAPTMMGPNVSNDTEVEALMWGCRMVVVLFNYTVMVNFFWMLIEGLYLHTLIVWAYSSDKIRMWPYCVIAYCVPAVFVTIWGIVRRFFLDVNCWLPVRNYHYELIVQIPVLLVLLINLGFLTSIVWVLLTKLRATNTLQVKQYKKAVKATFVLLHLLGVTYVLFITPYGDSETSIFIFSVVNAFLQSTQGLAVAVFICFVNNEVRATIRIHIFRWQEHRQVSTRYSRASIGHGDQMYSSRKNSMALSNIYAFRNGKNYSDFSRKDYTVANNNGHDGPIVLPMLDERV